LCSCVDCVDISTFVCISERITDIQFRLFAYYNNTDFINPTCGLNALGSPENSVNGQLSTMCCVVCCYGSLQQQRATKACSCSCVPCVSASDYCNAVNAATSKTITDSDQQQRVLNAAARVVCDTGKFDRGVSTFLHNELH